MVKKANNIKAKTNLQLPFYIKEIDFRYLKDYCLLAKKDKKDTYWELCNKVSNNDKNKAKFYNFSSANQPQIYASKKIKCSHCGGHLATEVNITKVAKKYKNQAKNLSHVKCYTCKQKSNYTNKCPKKSKNKWRSQWLPY